MGKDITTPPGLSLSIQRVSDPVRHQKHSPSRARLTTRNSRAAAAAIEGHPSWRADLHGYEPSMGARGCGSGNVG
jgi:hypothetical protein